MTSAHNRQSIKTYIMYIDTTSNLLPIGTEMHASVFRVMKLELWQYLHYSKSHRVCRIQLLGC